MRVDHPPVQALFVGASETDWARWSALFAQLGMEPQFALRHQELPKTLLPGHLALTVLAGTPDFVLSQAPGIGEHLRSFGTPMLLLLTSDDARWVLPALGQGQLDSLDPQSPPELMVSRLAMYLHLHHTRLALSESRQRLDDELELATRIQQGFLPRALPTEERVLSARYHNTCASLGGDLHDLFTLGRGRLGLYLADVSGHGTSAALLSGLVKMSFETLKEHIDPRRLPVSELLDPGVMLMRTNAALHDGLPNDVFVTLQYAVIDPRAQYLRFSTAGHPYPLLARAATRDVAVLQIPPGPALGPFRDAHFPVSTLGIFPGDTLVFYTDGLTETMNEQGEEFGIQRMKEVVGRDPALAPQGLVEELVGELNAFRADAPVTDDCSLVVLQIT